MEADGRKKLLKQSMFAGDPSQVLLEIGTEQVRQVLPASLVVVIYAEQGTRVRERFYTLYCDWRCSVRLNGEHFLQAILNSARRVAAGALDISPPSAFEAILFQHGISLLEEAAEKNTWMRADLRNMDTSRVFRAENY